MFDELVETKISGDGKVTVIPITVPVRRRSPFLGQADH
jgi:hypothetical protein